MVTAHRLRVGLVRVSHVFDAGDPGERSASPDLTPSWTQRIKTKLRKKGKTKEKRKAKNTSVTISAYRHRQHRENRKAG